MNYIFKKYRELERTTMTEEKRKSAKNDYFAFYIGRPLSYILTIPFLKSKITPNQISYASIIPNAIGFLLMILGNTKFLFAIGWLMFFLWNLLDGVDGNLARYRKQFSKDGGVIDAMAGYSSMALTFLAVGAAASTYSEPVFSAKLLIILGGLSSISLIFPRLVMHKYINEVGKNASAESVKNKQSFSPLKIFALNLTSITGLPQVFILIAILTETLDYLTVFYFIVNITVMLGSLYSILRKRGVVNE